MFLDAYLHVHGALQHIQVANGNLSHLVATVDIAISGGLAEINSVEYLELVTLLQVGRHAGVM